MATRVHTDLTIRGTTYPDAASAARALGVTPEAIRSAARKGRLDRVGTGRKGLAPMPVRIRGEVFTDAHAAAARFGVTPQAVWRALADGEPDRIGRPQRRPGRAPKPFEIGGLRFASQRKASRALGFSDDYLSHALTRGSRAARERILAAAMALSARQARKSSPNGPACPEPMEELHHG
ncbi:hypothetical protein [Rhodovulum sulfidophilum]|uniref:Helix-turn-helix domain-containing protein n=2 Tax=Rhodovulum sulfidophilum TaxID=35806 RepID=A0ABS1S2A6_RHOSU|nr:hypothetical protein [Rhodovulum sulfidophilum]MBL3611304.1 hypothetical protein [Rhodovulum sulfidophilum]